MSRQQVALLLCIIAALALATDAARTGAAKQIPAIVAHKVNEPSPNSDKYAAKDAYNDPEYSTDGYSGEVHHKYGYSSSNPILVNSPKNCDFKHGENINICLHEVSREPPYKIVSSEVNEAQTVRINSTFGCCAKGGYLPSVSAPIGTCQWSVTFDDTPSRVPMAEKLGTVSAICTITADAPCIDPLGIGCMFEIATNVPKTAIWKRMPAAILEKPDYDEYTYPYGAPAKTEGDKDTAKADSAKDPAKTEYADEADSRRYNRHEEEDDAQERREYERDDEYYGDDGYYPSVEAVRGKADIYTGLLTAFEGPGSNEVYCGKVEFVADFIDSTGVVRCPAQPADDPRNYAGKFNATDYDSSGPVPVVDCGMYEITLVKDHPAKHGHRGKYDN